jgi:hypothetical protein
LTYLPAGLTDVALSDAERSLQITRALLERIHNATPDVLDEDTKRHPSDPVVSEQMALPTQLANPEMGLIRFPSKEIHHVIDRIKESEQHAALNDCYPKLLRHALLCLLFSHEAETVFEHHYNELRVALLHHEFELIKGDAHHRHPAGEEQRQVKIEQEIVHEKTHLRDRLLALRAFQDACQARHASREAVYDKLAMWANGGNGGFQHLSTQEVLFIFQNSKPPLNTQFKHAVKSSSLMETEVYSLYQQILSKGKEADQRAKAVKRQLDALEAPNTKSHAGPSAPTQPYRPHPLALPPPQGIHQQPPHPQPHPPQPQPKPNAGPAPHHS